jgi:hypothetical protein
MPTAVVDDQDARVEYTGHWSIGGSAVNYLNTLHSSNESGAAFTFNFNGDLLHT